MVLTVSIMVTRGLQGKPNAGIAEVAGSNPVEALIFSGFFFPIA